MLAIYKLISFNYITEVNEINEVNEKYGSIPFIINYLFPQLPDSSSFDSLIILFMNIKNILVLL